MRMAISLLGTATLRHVCHERKKPILPERERVMNGNPRILLLVNSAWWVVGEMGKQIVERFGDKYDFYFMTEGLFERRPELLQSVVSAVDVVHCLNESAIGLFRDVDQEALPPIATWIHHVTTW